MAVVEETSKKKVNQKTKSLLLWLQLRASMGKRTEQASRQMMVKDAISRSDGVRVTAVGFLILEIRTRATVKFMVEPKMANRE